MQFCLLVVAYLVLLLSIEVGANGRSRKNRQELKNKANKEQREKSLKVNILFFLYQQLIR